jgi:uncharacterized protein
MSPASPDIAAFRKILKPEAALISVPGLFFSSRAGRTLVVEPESASWTVLDRAPFDFLTKQGLIRPDARDRSLRTVAELRTRDTSTDWAKTEELLFELFTRNMLAVDGQTYYQPSRLWSAQRHPHYFNIHVSESCNLACRYCRVDHGGRDPMLMKVDVCKRIIRRVLEEIPGEKVIIGFHGGEPLLNAACIAEGAGYAREVAAALGKKVTLSLQTNGVLLDRHAGLLKELNIEVGVSLDGPETIHDRYRVLPSGRGSFGLVVNGLKAARKAGLNPGLLAVVHEPADYLEVADFMAGRLDACSFRLNYSCFEGRAKRELDFEVDRGEAFARGWLQLVDFALEHHRRTKTWLGIDDLNLFTAHLLTKVRPHMCYRSPCGAGNSILGFGYDGRIYPCEELVGKAEFALGTVDAPTPLAELLETSELNRRLQEERKVENVARCRDCPWKRFHGSGCLNKSYEYFGATDFEDPMCRFYRRVFEGLMWRLAENPELVNLTGQYRKYVT